MGSRKLIVLVCGGRTYADGTRAKETFDLGDALDSRADKIELLIHGEATGADQAAGRWADRNGVPCFGMKAPWKKHPKAGGPIRNGWMLKYGKPDVVWAFPGNSGTADMIKQATAAGIPIERLGDWSASQ